MAKKKYVNETPEETRLRKNAYRRAWYAQHPELCKLYKFRCEMRKEKREREESQLKEAKFKEENENGMAV